MPEPRPATTSPPGARKTSVWRRIVFEWQKISFWRCRALQSAGSTLAHLRQVSGRKRLAMSPRAPTNLQTLVAACGVIEMERTSEFRNSERPCIQKYTNTIFALWPRMCELWWRASAAAWTASELALPPVRFRVVLASACLWARTGQSGRNVPKYLCVCRGLANRRNVKHTGKSSKLKHACDDELATAHATGTQSNSNSSRAATANTRQL